MKNFKLYYYYIKKQLTQLTLLNRKFSLQCNNVGFILFILFVIFVMFSLFTFESLLPTTSILKVFAIITCLFTIILFSPLYSFCKNRFIEVYQQMPIFWSFCFLVFFL
jgi:hypothetical protein